MKLQDKVAIITGGGRGLGRSVALAFGREGAKVVVAARTKETIDHVAVELRSLKKSVLAMPVDISDENQVDLLVQKTLKTFGTIDILVNNAGTRGPIGPICNVLLEEWEKTIKINLTATFLCSKAVLPVMMEKKKGKIINVATTMSLRPNLTPYCVAKAGVVHFSKQLAREVKNFNIQVNAIHPGVMDTQMQAEIRQAGVEAIGTDLFERIKEEGILHSPDEPAQLVVFLASKAADGITGDFLSFDDKEVKFLISQA
ncbi:MAG: SDR family oxidoreductase [Deltaproteobacteria bacterium]|nr:SDR family oxidoreductase [Deltaproteobacteria bacterium]MBW2306927.1 SDR family oxidoreductase [Deltaproteobacteria bacterium]